MSPGRALITGGAGFLGLHLARRLLADGWSVVILDDHSRGQRDADLEEVASTPGVSVVTADLRHPETLASVGTDLTHVFHAAARLGVAAVAREPMAVLRDNVALTEAALDLAVRQPHLERFVFPSTSEVYAGTQEVGGLSFPTPEDTVLTVPPLERPRTSYMLSKIYGEALCHHSGLPVTIVRPHNAYGPRMGNAHVVPQLLHRISLAAPGDPLVVHSPEHRRTFCFVEDAVAQITSLSGAETAVGGTYNVGVEAPEVTMSELASRLLAVTGRADLALVPGEVTSGSPSRRCPDMTATAATTGHRATADLDEGLARTWAWYLQHGFTGES